MKIIDRIKKKFSQISEMIKSKFAKKDKDIIEEIELGQMFIAALKGDNKAIINLTYFLNHHPEMYDGLEHIRDCVKKNALQPDFLNNANAIEGGIIGVKKDYENNQFRLLDIGVINTNGKNIVFHTNRKRFKEKEYEKLKEKRLQVETPTPSTHGVESAGGLMIDNNLSSSTNVRYATANDEIISQQTKQSNITDNITKMQERQMQEVDISNIDKNDSLAMDEFRSEFSTLNTQENSDTNINSDNKLRKNRQ